MKHEPERNAAAYLSNVFSARARRRFEAHILECEDCWREVETARAGRSVAEAGRDLAPQGLRERVRASVATVEPSRPRRTYGLIAVAGAMVAAALVTVFVMEAPQQPHAIEVVLADFRHESSIGPPSDPEMPSRVGDLRLSTSRSGSLDGHEMDVHRYEDQAGHQVAVYSGDEVFPMARGAEALHQSETWVAEVEGAFIFCSDTPHPSLVVGDDEREVMMAAKLLGMLEV